MQLIHKSEINREKWDALVINSPKATIYNQSLFLDVLAENWMLLINNDYSAGLPIPFTIRAGVKGIYTPNFCREFSFIGFANLSDSEITQSIQLLENEFKFCSLNLVENYFQGQVEQKVFQQLSSKQPLNSQAKLSCKKFEKSGLILEKTIVDTVLPIVSEELAAKVKSLRKIDLDRFEQMIHSLPTDQLLVLGVKDENQWLGGLIFIHWKSKLHYIKGGAKELAKNDGAMFAMMNNMINYAIENQLELDFGGSNVEGVKRFNKSFGATDQQYFEWKWNHSPKWFSLLQKLKSRFKK